MTDLIWSFAPWLAFLLATRVTSIYGAIGAGALAALVVLTRAIRQKQVHMLDGFSFIYFLAIGAVLIAVRPDHLNDWARFAQAGSHLALTLLVFGSIVLGHPFTESYARKTVPQSVWDTDRFRSLNQLISIIWGLAFLVGTLSLVAAGSVDSRQILLRVVVPFGALYYAYKFTQAKTKAARSYASQGVQQEPQEAISTNPSER